MYPRRHVWNGAPSRDVRPNPDVPSFRPPGRRPSASSGADRERHRYDAAHRLTRITLQPGAPYAAQTYDLNAATNGNRLRKTRDDGSDTPLYTWDGRDRLVRIERGGDTPRVAEFGYDPLGRRSTRTVNGLTTRYLYDGPQAIAGLTDGRPLVALLTGLQIDEAIARYSEAALPLRTWPESSSL